MNRFQFKDVGEAWRFVEWAITQDDFPYITYVEDTKGHVVIFPIGWVQVDEE